MPRIVLVPVEREEVEDAEIIELAPVALAAPIAALEEPSVPAGSSRPRRVTAAYAPVEIPLRRPIIAVG